MIYLGHVADLEQKLNIKIILSTAPGNACFLCLRFAVLTPVQLLCLNDVVTVAFFAHIAGLDSMGKERQMLVSPFLQNYGTSWIAGPEGYHYQFHLSEQSWNMAREYCLTLASDLVIIKSLQQMNWLLSHYPISNSIMSERTVQIGLVLVDKEKSTEKEWKWVDNTPLNATYLEWEMLTNTTEKFPSSTKRGRCALLNIDNRILKTVLCEQTPDFDYTNRFICQRSDEQHLEFKRNSTNIPARKEKQSILRVFTQLISKLRDGEAVKPEPRIIQIQEVKTDIPHIQRKTECAIHLFLKHKILETRNHDKILKTTVNPDVEGTNKVDFTIEQKEIRGEAKNKIADRNKNEFRAKNFLEKRKSVLRKEKQQENTENDENVLLADGIEAAFKRNITISNNSVDLSNQDSQQSNKFCMENDTKQKDSRTWYEQFDLRALLDNNGTNKTLNKIDDQQQFDDSIPEELGISNTLARKIKAEGKSGVTRHIYDTTEADNPKIFGKVSAEKSEVNDDRIYRQLGKKLKTILMEHLQNLSNLDSNASNKSSKIGEDITSKTTEEQTNRNKALLHYDAINEQKPRSPSLSSTNLNNMTREIPDILHTSLNNMPQTTESNNDIVFEHQDCSTILLKKYQVDGNKTDMKVDIEKAISNMKQNLENASEEIKRLFLHSRKRL
ncbi:Lectin C-type domain-containing protein [Dirofilaria immitis]|nr:Lectin C-type domain-containing protein [Dirofilaria immitis]